MSYTSLILNRDIEYLKGVGPKRGELLRKELNVKCVGDLLFIFPFRYVDRTEFQLIQHIYQDGQQVQLKGKLIELTIKQGRNRKRLVGFFKDSSGFIELIWFQRIKWIQDILEAGKEYVVFGRVKLFKGKKSIAHPEVELLEQRDESQLRRFAPVYNSTEKLNSKGLDSKVRRKLIQNIFELMGPGDIQENLNSHLLKTLKLCSRYEAIKQIHFPSDVKGKEEASNRLKFEELFFLQLQLLQNRARRKLKYKGFVFSKIGQYFLRFYEQNLAFELTNAQKKVLKEIRYDLGSGQQMNRLLQGDVGSGKTVVGFMSMLIALDNEGQACLMAPTEILAQQHFKNLNQMAAGLGIRIAFLSGSVTGNQRKELLKFIKSGDIHILVGTHALLEEPVQFKNLTLAITDEQHRFGVAQRAKLWKKNIKAPPHILVMTATPIPRTLAMTLYGDLDVSVIDELPPGRKMIKTTHRFEPKRPQVIQFMHQEIAKGHQIYVVFPLIEESETLDLQNLQVGYEQLLPYFPKPKFQFSIVHGRMKPADKELEMKRFIEKKTQIMVATTVIEVGVDVPNASVMIIESAERFGLSQLHQLRGRVGRGAEQSYCILMTGYKLSNDAKERIQTMCRTNNGFEIADVDMRLRGPGNIEGTQQSGVMDLKIANIVQDGAILRTARVMAEKIIGQDINLTSPENRKLANHLKDLRASSKDWGRIS